MGKEEGRKKRDLPKEESENSEDFSSANSEVDGENDALGSIMSKILRTSSGPTQQPQETPQETLPILPILAKRRAVERKLEEEKLDRRAKAIVRAELRERRDAAHAIPNIESANYEKDIKKFATKGVVQLFNAVHQHQMAKEKAAKSKKEAQQNRRLYPNTPVTTADATKEAKAISKATFLELLKMGVSRPKKETAEVAN